MRPVSIILPSGQIIDKIAAKPEEEASKKLANSMYRNAKIITKAQRDALINLPDEDRNYELVRAKTPAEKTVDQQKKNQIIQQQTRAKIKAAILENLALLQGKNIDANDVVVAIQNALNSP